MGRFDYPSLIQFATAQNEDNKIQRGKLLQLRKEKDKLKKQIGTVHDDKEYTKLLNAVLDVCDRIHNVAIQAVNGSDNADIGERSPDRTNKQSLKNKAASKLRNTDGDMEKIQKALKDVERLSGEKVALMEKLNLAEERFAREKEILESVGKECHEEFLKSTEAITSLHDVARTLIDYANEVRDDSVKKAEMYDAMSKLRDVASKLFGINLPKPADDPTGSKTRNAASDELSEMSVTV